MSEHDSHDDEQISTLYRRLSREAPSPQLDERVMATARRHTARRSHHWWLPLSTAAVVVLAVSLLLRYQQAPDELDKEIAKYEANPAPSVSAPAPAPAPAVPGKEARTRVKPAQQPKSYVADAPVAEAPLAETEKSAEPPAEAAKENAFVGALAPAADLAETKPSAAARSAAAPRAAAGELQKREAAVEAPEIWLKRIEALRAKGELDAAKRELAAFRKAYPAWPLSKELQALVPESAK